MAMDVETRRVRAKAGTDAVWELVRRHKWNYDVVRFALEIMNGETKKKASQHAAWYLKEAYPEEYEELRKQNLVAAGQPVEYKSGSSGVGRG